MSYSDEYIQYIIYNHNTIINNIKNEYLKTIYYINRNNLYSINEFHLDIECLHNEIYILQEQNKYFQEQNKYLQEQNKYLQYN
jgi:hypothetical protein